MEKNTPCEILAAQQKASIPVHEEKRLWITFIAIFIFDVGGNPTPCDQWKCCLSLNIKHLKANRFGKHGLST